MHKPTLHSHTLCAAALAYDTIKSFVKELALPTQKKNKKKSPASQKLNLLTHLPTDNDRRTNNHCL